MKTILAVFAAMLLVFSDQCAAGKINFDSDAYGNPINAPLDFNLTTSLTTLYSPLGVTFSAPGGSQNGGAILNVGSSFGVSARSGTNFLAFNPDSSLANGGIPMDPETIDFASAESLVTLYAATGQNGTASFELEGYLEGVLVASSSATSTSGYVPLSVSFPGGMNRVVLSGDAGRPFVVDDLSFQSVPEPSTLALLGAGGLGLIGWAWRRRSLKRVGEQSPCQLKGSRELASPTLSALRLAVLVSLMGSTGLQLAQGKSVLILGSNAGGATWLADVQQKIEATGRIAGSVNVLDVSTATPSLATLDAYGSVMVYSDSPGFQDATTLGNNLANYVDQGHGVVVACFANAGTDIRLGGRFVTGGYMPILPLSQNEYTDLTLGTIHHPGSPIFSGVTSFNGGSSSFYGTGGLAPGAIDDADWSNGVPLVAEFDSFNADVVALNFFPVSSTMRSDFWTASTNGGLLMANALNYAAAVPEPSTLALLGAGGLGLIGWAWQRLMRKNFALARGVFR